VVRVVEGLPLVIMASDECKGACPLAFVMVPDCSTVCDCPAALRAVGGCWLADVVGRETKARGS
jgi:hypothetical protein